MDTTLAVGVDLGGTKVVTALVDENGAVIARDRAATGPLTDPSATIAEIAAAVRGVASVAKERVVGVGVGAAGQIDPATGTVRAAPNLGWTDVPLRVELEEALQLPVLVTNDVRAAAWGEWMYGAGQGMTDMVCLFVGTGIGGGIIAGGRLLTGCSGSAGELGHTIVDRNGPRCRCGSQGCLEALAGGWAIAAKAVEAVDSNPEAGGTLLTLAEGDREKLTAELVSQAAHQGDRLAQRLVVQAGEALAVGVASLVNAFNPCMVVLGGGVIEGMPELLQMVQSGVPDRALGPAVASLRIQKAALGENAGVIGAAALARERFGDSDPATTGD